MIEFVGTFIRLELHEAFLHPCEILATRECARNVQSVTQRELTTPSVPEFD